MKNLQFAIIFQLLITVQFLQSQTFERIISTDLDEIALDAICIGDTSFIILSQRGDFNSHDYPKIIIYSMNDLGKLTDSLTITLDSLYTMKMAQYLFVDTNQNIIIAGRAEYKPDTTSMLYIAAIDTDLNLLFDTITGIIGISDVGFNYLLNQKNNLISVGFTEHDSVHNVFISEYSLSGELLNKKEYHWNAFSAGSVIELSEKSTYQLTMIYSTPGGIYELDAESLNVLDTLDYSGSYLGYDSRHLPQSQEYFVAGNKSVVGKWQLFITKINYNGQILGEHIYGVPDSNCFYSVNSIDVANQNELFLVGTHNFPNNPPFFSTEPRWIFANKLNTDGSIIWQRFYKGELSYMPYKVLATNDGGALILSTKYDWNDPVPNQRDIHILKVDSTGWYEGLPTGTTEFDQPKRILIYPNPARGLLNFVLGFYSGLDLEIYNSNGAVVKKEYIEHSTTIDISTFPKGLYVYILRGKNGFLEKGKLIKK